MLGAIKMAKHCKLGAGRRDRHGGDRRRTRCTRASCVRYLQRRHNRGELTTEVAAEIVGQHLVGAGTEHVLDATERERERIFNLGYFTWVEQQGIALADFDRRKIQAFWRACTTSCRSGTR